MWVDSGIIDDSIYSIIALPSNRRVDCLHDDEIFQDALKQKDIPYGPLWSDEGVYIAKELHLKFPEEFSNIFLGLGGFHLEKACYGCLN